jgi:uncharacterized protein
MTVMDPRFRGEASTLAEARTLSENHNQITLAGMRSLLLLAVFLILPLASAEAASFDCKKAMTRIEKTICSDPELSKADERLAAAFASAAALSLSPMSLRAEQADWVRERDKESSVKKLRESYQARNDTLDKQVAAWRSARQDVSVDQAKKDCVLSPESETDTPCMVTAFEPVPGDPSLHYQLQAYKDGELQLASGVVVFRPSADKLTPVIAVGGTDSHFEAPAALDTPFGRMLWLAGYVSGTGNFNAEHVFRYDKDRLVEIDVTSWLDDLQRRVPKGWGAWKGVYPDYRKFTASTPLWQGGDGNCCPTAGRADIRLGLDHDRLVLREVTIARGEKAAGEDH